MRARDFCQLEQRCGDECREHQEPAVAPRQQRRLEHGAQRLEVVARDLQRKDGQWTRGKGFDTFCALGPWIETEFDPSDALITCRVNGDLKQMASSRDMVFDVPHLVAFVSSFMTIEAGDILMTGTPAGVSPLSPGDVVEVTIDGIGNLRNPVRAE
jgi:2-keto-4-pentenoate hydratase/2-oxohepta-3-ene-1,7-dioic acid hydratase in catechol pathway